jgi:hypothetical protein
LQESGAPIPTAKRSSVSAYRPSHISLLAVAAVAALGSPRLASASPGTDSVSFGVGVDAHQLASGAGDFLIAGRNSAPLNFYVQLKLLPRLRLETSAAYFHVARNAANTPTGGSSYDFTATAVGLGAIYYLAFRGPFGLYAGGRVTVARYSGHFTDKPLLDPPKVTKMNLFLAPAMGGEVALSHRLFVGAEMQLPYAVSGDRSARTRGTSDTPNVGAGRLGTDTILFLRYLVY